MTKSKRVTKRPWVDRNDAPELTQDFFKRAEIAKGGKVIHKAQGTLTRPRGRPRVDRPTQTLTLRLDPDLVRDLKASGPDWRQRATKALARVARKGA